MASPTGRITDETRPEKPRPAVRHDDRANRATLDRVTRRGGTSKASLARLETYRRRFSHEAILRGIDAGVLKEGIGQGILRLEEVQRFIPASTLARKVRERRKLAREEADQVARLLRVKAYARGVFEDAATAEAWLSEPNPALGRRAPMELLTTDEGTRAVETVLRRIDYGDYS
jgi:putative toxin-antitoxin system antitoxin component (TIGR02293 family)